MGNRLGIKQQCTHMWATATYLLWINNINMFWYFLYIQLTYVHYLQTRFLVYRDEWQLGMEVLGAKWKSQLYDFPPTLPWCMTKSFSFGAWMEWDIKLDETWVEQDTKLGGWGRFHSNGLTLVLSTWDKSNSFWIWTFCLGGLTKFHLYFFLPPFERLSFGIECACGGGQPNWFLVILLAWTSWD